MFTVSSYMPRHMDTCVCIIYAHKISKIELSHIRGSVPGPYTGSKRFGSSPRDRQVGLWVENDQRDNSLIF